MSGASARSELGRFGLREVLVREVVGDVSFADPYRQLEDETPAVQAWQADRHERAGEALAAIAGLGELVRELELHLLADRLVAPVPAGGRWLWCERDAAGFVRRVRSSDTLEAGPGRLVAEASVVPLDGDEAIEWIVPSPDGRLLALAVSSHGDEQSTLALVDVETGVLVGAPTRHVGAVAWLPDGSGLYASVGQAPSQELPLRRLAFLRPGERAAVLDAPPLAAAAQLQIQVSHDARHVAVVADLGSPRLLYVLDRVAESWTAAFPDETDRVFYGAFADGEYVAVTDVGGERTRLVAASPARVADPASWRELLAGEEAVLRGVAAIDGGLVVCELADGRPRLRLLDRDGTPHACVPLAPGLTLSSNDRLRAVAPHGIPARHHDGELVFTASACDRPATLWRYRLRDGALDELTAPALQPPPVRAETLVCAAPDGQTVRYDAIRRADLPDDEPSPLLLHGYGGFNEASLPCGYPAIFMPWIAAGGTYVFAHLRGDGTFGTARWRAGRRAAKERTFDDLIACAEDLLARGMTTRSRLALAGVSNGGLLASAVLVRRPELFRAVAALVPIADMARLSRERFPEAFRAEYGDVRLVEEARWLRAYSPCHHVEPGVRYPATIVVGTDRDMRTHAWHARKLAAALLDASADAPLLLRVHRDRGHSSAVVADPAFVAEWLGFLMEQVGLPLARRDDGWRAADLSTDGTAARLSGAA